MAWAPGDIFEHEEATTQPECFGVGEGIQYFSSQGGTLIIPLPIVEGIGPSCVRVPGGPWRNILEYLEERFPNVQSATWIARMKKGKVADDMEPS